MKRMIVCIALVTVGLVGGCGRQEPRATTYFAAHLDEARKLVADCRSGSIRGQECANADVQEADARERFKRFRGG